MEQTLDNQIPTQKIYKERAIQLGTFIGGPLVAGYLIAENFKSFNENKKATLTCIYTVISTVVLFIIIFSVLENTKIPNYLFPVIYTNIAYYLTKHLQGENITSHKNSMGQFFSWWRVAGIGLIGLVFTFVVTFVFVLLFVS